MPICCPPGRGCNSSQRDEPCVLQLCRDVAGEEPQAAQAVARWDAFREASRARVGKRERRFRRRTYERSRDDALGTLLMRAQTAPGPQTTPAPIGVRALDERTGCERAQFKRTNRSLSRLGGRVRQRVARTR